MSKRRLVIQNEQKEDQTGGIGGGVESVTGTAVDNTDPLNPIINLPSLSIIDKGVSTATGFFTPTRVNNYQTPFNIFRNTTYSWLSSYYDIRRVIEVELSGDCTVPASGKLSLGLKIDSVRWLDLSVFGGSFGLNSVGWSIRFVLTTSSTSELKITGVLLCTNHSPTVGLINAGVDFSVNRSISVEGLFQDDNVANMVRSNQIYVRILS